MQYMQVHDLHVAMILSHLLVGLNRAALQAPCLQVRPGLVTDEP